jgi:hypothetical protein
LLLETLYISSKYLNFFSFILVCFLQNILVITLSINKMKTRISLLIFALIPLVGFSQTRVVDNKGTLRTIDESKWTLSGSDIYLKQSGKVGIGTTSPQAKLHVKGSTLFETTVIGDLSSGGPIGTAVATVDSYTSINLNQTTAGQTISLPSPTNTSAGRILQVNNIGTASVTIGEITIDALQTAEFVWNGTHWAVPTAVPLLISGAKTFSAAPSAPSLKLSDNTNQLQFNTGTANIGTLAWTPTAARTITLPNASGTVALISDITSPTLSGDVTGTVGATTLTSIQGKALSAVSPVDKQVLQYEASTSTWKPSSASTFYSLNNLTASAQLLAIGTAGTAPAWNSLTSTHTLDIPMASTASVTAGLLSNADWTSFNTKVSSVAAGSTKVTIGGTATAPTVDVDPSKLGTITLATTAGTGTDVSVTGSPANLGGTLTLNMPDASATARGVITTGTQTIAGNKIFSGSTTVFGSGEGGTPTDTYIRGPQAGGSGTPGANLYIQASNGTGAGGSGNIIFQTGSAATVSVPTLVNTVSQTSSAAIATFSNYTVSSGANRLLMVAINLANTGASISSISYGASPFTKLPNSDAHMAIWYLINPPAGVNNIVVTLSYSCAVSIAATTWENVNQAAPFGTVLTTPFGYNTGSVSLSPVSSLGQVVVDFLISDTSPTPTSAQSVLVSNHDTQFYHTNSYKAATASNTTMSYSFAAANCEYMAFAIQSPTSGGGNALSPALTINNTGNTVIASGKSLAFADGSANTVSLAAPSSVSTYKLTLPAGQGSGGQTLMNDGAGGLSWGIPTSSYTLPVATAGTLGGVKVGSGLSVDAAGVISAATSGTVSSVGLSLPAEMTVSNSPITSTGTLTAAWASQTVNKFFAAPSSGSGIPTFRAIVAADIPTLNQSTTGTAANVTGIVAASNGGTGQSTYAVGDLLYASTTSVLSKLTAAAAGNVLTSGGAGTAPSWGKIGLTTHVSGVLPAANGGTGVANSGTITLGGNLTTSGAFATTISSTGATSVTLPTSGTLYGTALGSITSSQLATSLSDEMGTGSAVFSTSPTLTTPVINGAISGTTVIPPVNGGTGVANSGTITLGGNLTTSGAFATTITSTGTTSVTLPTSGTLVNSGVLNAVITLTTATPGPYSPNPGTTKLLVYIVGGGGQGGGAAASNGSAGAGGGGGGVVIDLIPHSGSTTYSFSVGAGGTTGTNGTIGAAGTSTTFNGVTASGGAGGALGNSTSSLPVAGGIGGAATGGDINIPGDNGTQGVRLANTSACGLAGNGGSSPFGRGGQGKVGTAAAGGAASGYGAGGGGAQGSVSTGSTAGGAGGAGVIIIYEYK